MSTSSLVRPKSTNEPFDAKIESFLMYKHVLCELFTTPNSIAVHQSEPFNIDVEYARLSSTFNELELLDKDYIIVERIKISSIQNVDIVNSSNNSNISLSSSNGSLSSSSGSMTPPSSPSSQLSLARSTSSSGGLAIGSPSSKAQQLLGLEEGGSSASPPTTSKKASSLLLGPNSTNSPKFGLLARSASNNMLRDNSREDKDLSRDRSLGSSGSNNSAMSTPINPSPLAMSMGGGNTLSMSPVGMSPLGMSLGSSPGSASSLMMGGGGSTSSMMSSAHYGHGISIQTKEMINYSLNARDKDDSMIMVDGLKLLSSGRPHLDSSQTTLDAITEALDTAFKCRLPTVPSLPSTPPPPPPFLRTPSAILS